MNKAAVDYFFVELRLESHFEALRHFLLMEDGEFAQSLSDLLFEKVSPGVEGARRGLRGAGRLDALGPCALSASARGRPDTRGAAEPTGAEHGAEQGAAVQPAW